LKLLFLQDNLESRYRKGRTILDFMKQEMTEWQWHQLDHKYAESFKTDHLITQIFYEPDALPAAQLPTVSKH